MTSPAPNNNPPDYTVTFRQYSDFITELKRESSASLVASARQLRSGQRLESDPSALGPILDSLIELSDVAEQLRTYRHIIQFPTSRSNVRATLQHEFGHVTPDPTLAGAKAELIISTLDSFISRSKQRE